MPRNYKRIKKKTTPVNKSNVVTVGKLPWNKTLRKVKLFSIASVVDCISKPACPPVWCSLLWSVNHTIIAHRLTSSLCIRRWNWSKVENKPSLNSVTKHNTIHGSETCVSVSLFFLLLSKLFWAGRPTTSTLWKITWDSKCCLRSKRVTFVRG